MKKVIEVREYESIIYNEAYKNEPSYHYVDEAIFNQLETFVLRNQEDAGTEVMDFLKLSSKKHVGKVIQAKNYVGLIQLENGVQVQILPKLYKRDVEETKRVFMKMLKAMKDFPSKVFNQANIKADKMNLYEIFINMYIQEVRDLIKKGIHSAYVSCEDNRHYYKGKLQVSQHIKYNSVHQERFYVRYDEFNVDRAENRLIKSTLLKLQKISSSGENVKAIRQILTHFKGVKASKHYVKDLSSIRIDRNTKDYEMIMKWSKVFLMNESFTTFEGDNSSRALLFPMERVFEAYIAKQLKKHYAGTEWQVSTQDRGYYLFDEPRQFALRPDIVMTHGDGRVIVLDTKWKMLINNRRKNYGIAQSDMYQMYAYGKKYGAQEVWLIYPMNEEMKDCGEIGFCSDDGVRVRVWLVDVGDAGFMKNMNIEGDGLA